MSEANDKYVESVNNVQGYDFTDRESRVLAAGLGALLVMIGMQLTSGDLDGVPLNPEDFKAIAEKLVKGSKPFAAEDKARKEAAQTALEEHLSRMKEAVQEGQSKSTYVQTDSKVKH